MKTFECKCGSRKIFIKKETDKHNGLYCAECGKWIQWLGKNDLRIAELQMKQREPSIEDFIDYLNNNAFELRHDIDIIQKYADEYLNQL